MPIVDILTLSPLSLESGLALADGLRIIEVPQSLLSAGRRHRRLGGIVAVTLCALLLYGLFGLSLLGGPFFLTFFRLQSLDDAVDGLIALFLGQTGQHLQRVLQMDGVGVGHEFVEHFRPLRQFLIIAALLVQQSDSLAVTPLRVVVTLLSPIEIAEMKQQYTLLDAAARGFLVARLIRADSSGGVALGEIDVTDSVVDLIEIVLVVVRCGHAAQPAYHLTGAAGGHHLRLGNAGVEFQFVRRIQADDFLICAISLLAVSKLRLNLPHEKPLAGTLLPATLMLDDAGQRRHGFFISVAADVERSLSVVPVCPRTIVDGVAPHFRQDVFCVVEPVQLRIAAGEPRAGDAVDGGLRGIEAGHVGERRGSFVKLAFQVLRLAHQKPRFPEERVIFAAAQPLNVLGRLASRLRPFGSALDAVLFDGLFRLFDGTVKIGLSNFAGSLVADHRKGYHFGKIVLIASFLLLGAVDKGETTVIISVITGIERVPPAAAGGVLFR